MSLLGLTVLHSGPNQTGSVALFGMGVSDRYNHLTHDFLASQGLLNSVASGTITCKTADLNLILFDTQDYTGGFFQLSKAAGGDATFWHSGPAESALLIASKKQGEHEHRFSFRDQFQQEWDSIVDDQMHGTQVSRVGEPLLTWAMFPDGVSYLDSNQTYLRIHQPLHIQMPWYWSDYSGYMDYHLVLYIDGGGHLRAWGARWECNVDSGLKHDKILDQLAPKVKDGLSALQDSVNEKLKVTDGLGPFKSVYYLPGSQLSPVENAGFGGNTADDITLVVVS